MNCFQDLAPGYGSFLAIGLMIAMALLAFWTHRQEYFQGRSFFLIAVSAVAVWLAVVALEQAFVAPACKILMAKVAWPVIALLPAAWLLFAHNYVRSRPDRFTPQTLVVLLSGPVVITALAATNSWHGLFYGPETGPVDASPGAPVYYDHGPFYYGAVVYLYGFVLGSLYYFGEGVFRARAVYRPFFLLLLLVTSLPTLGDTAYSLFGFTVADFDPTPYTFAIVVLVCGWLILSRQLFGPASVARNLLFETHPAPVLALDPDGVLLDANPAAIRLLELPRGWRHRRGSEFELVARLLSHESGAEQPFELTDRHFDVQVTPIETPLGDQADSLGSLYVLTEVSVLVRRQQALQASVEAERARYEEIARLHERLQFMERTDPLTGLLNRRDLPSHFERYRQQLESEGGRLIVTLIDIDDFQRINEVRGHAAGDQALRNFARGILRYFPNRDDVFRVGGDQFLVLSPATELFEVRERLAHLRTFSLAMSSVGRTIPDLGFSAGIAIWEPGQGAFEAIFRDVEARLRRARQRGEAQVEDGRTA